MLPLKVTYVFLSLAPPIALFFGLFWHNIVPSGVFRISFIPSEHSAYVGSFLPAERTDTACIDTRGTCVTIIDDPVYLFVSPPVGNFAHVRMRVQFDPGDQGIVEFGPMTDLFFQRFQLFPVAHRLLESLSWTDIHDNGDGTTTNVWSRVLPHVTVAEALQLSWPARSTLAYKTDIHPTVDTDHLAPQSQSLLLPQLIGAHEARLFGAVELSCTTDDANLVPGDDSGNVVIRGEDGTVLGQFVLADDAVRTPIHLTTSHAGVASLAFTGTSDVSWNECMVQTRGLVFKHRLQIGASAAFSVTTNSSRLAVRATSTQGLQTVRIGDKNFSLTTVGEIYTFPNSADLFTIDFVHGNVEIVGDGMLGFSSSMFFFPDTLPLAVGAMHLPDPADTVVATLAPVQVNVDGWREVTLQVDLSKVVRERDALRFALSVPEVETSHAPPKIHRIDMTFIGEPMTLRAFARATISFFHRLL